MRRLTALLTCGMVVMLFGLLNATRAQDSAGGLSRKSSVATYPGTPDGLKSFLTDFMNAVKSGDNAALGSYLDSVEIPDHTAWFNKMFNPTDAARLDAKYSQLLPQFRGRLTPRFNYALDAQVSAISVLIASPTDTVYRALGNAMLQPFPIYTATSANTDSHSTIYIGDFVYIDGRFRYLDTEVDMAVTGAPPMRIRVGKGVEDGALVSKVPPVYPADAEASHVAGTVLLRILVAVDGSVKDVTVISGDPALANAAMEAVKLWRYKPYLLNGTPIEVESTVDVAFPPR